MENLLQVEWEKQVRLLITLPQPLALPEHRLLFCTQVKHSMEIWVYFKIMMYTCNFQFGKNKGDIRTY